MAEAERQRYGYTTEGGERVSALRDMFNGGGPGRSGPTFQGGGILSDIGNAMGGPSSFGGEGGNRGATIGRTVGGMMFGPLGMIGGGILGNMLGGGMSRGQAPAASPMPVPATRRAPSPAMAAMPRPAAYAPTPAGAPMSTQPGFFAPSQAMPSTANMPSAVERFIAQYGGMPAVQAGYTPPALPGAVPVSSGVTMPGGVTMPRMAATGYMPRASMPMDPMMDPRNMVSLPIDRMTGRPMAMTPPRVR
jgi:hypothetical protein